MKTVLVIAIVAFAAYYFFVPSGSEKVNSALSVIKQKQENRLVEHAGKSEVVLDMAEKRVENLRDRLIALKSSKLSIERKLSETKQPDLKDKLSKTLKALSTCELRAEESLKKSKANLETLRAKLEILDTEIAISKISSKVINETNENYNKDEIKELIRSIEGDLDNANAELDVAEFETK